jgi:hypothetical protein
MSKIESGEVGGAEASNEEQIQEAIAILRRGRYVVLCCIEQDDQLTVIRKGIPEVALPGALRHFAETLAGMMASKAVEEAAQEVLEATPESAKGRCPSCKQVVVMCSPESDLRALRSGNITQRAVCGCGAFLVPYSLDDGGLGLRIMTMDEVAALPDGSRNQMLSLRKRYAAYMAKNRPRRTGDN